MSQRSGDISSVPTNIITGFLGVGKTSTILHFLQNKPKDERWAVLVNEFGEIGIDGALFEGQYSEQEGVFIREVPGGCMCCTAGLPMRVALAQLLRRARPDRLLIEATGLGHPEEVLQTLSDQSFLGVISIQKVVTLVDARNLSNSRYAEHQTFQQQMAIADLIVANKQDLYSDHDRASLTSYLQAHRLSDINLVFAEQGVIEPSLLNGLRAPDAIVDGEKSATLNQTIDIFEAASAANESESGDKDSSGHLDGLDNINIPIPECGFIKALNHGEGFASVGWRFSERFEFDRNKLFAFLTGLDVERLKATFITHDGCFAYNLAGGALSEIPFEGLDESRIEIISLELSQHWEADLLNCERP